jgi:hypothetical protein
VAKRLKVLTKGIRKALGKETIAVDSASSNVHSAVRGFGRAGGRSTNPDRRIVLPEAGIFFGSVRALSGYDKHDSLMNGRYLHHLSIALIGRSAAPHNW